MIERTGFRLAIAGIAVLGLLAVGTAARADGPYANSAYFSGQGLIADGFGGFDLITETCGVANGAEVDGPYLLWLLTATKSDNADITGPWGTAAMTKFGNGTFKYVSDWYDPDTLPGNVAATYDGKAKNAQLVVSHGCRPFIQGAWCSPGFWKNADNAAWELIGLEKDALFNQTVVPDFYDTTSSYDPTLWDVLNYGGPGGANHFGAAADPYGLNAFNATGAFLTDNIPGFQFDYDLFVQAQNTGETTYMCPIDSHGNFKQ